MVFLNFTLFFSFNCYIFFGFEYTHFYILLKCTSLKQKKFNLRKYFLKCSYILKNEQKRPSKTDFHQQLLRLIYFSRSKLHSLWVKKSGVALTQPFSEPTLQQQKVLFSPLYSYLNFSFNAPQLNVLTAYTFILYSFQANFHILTGFGNIHVISTNKYLFSILDKSVGNEANIRENKFKF